MTFAVQAGTVGLARLSDEPLSVVVNESVWVVIASFAMTLSWWALIRQMGSVHVIDLEAIFERHLVYNEDEFQKDMIYTAGQHAIANESLSRRKSLGADLMVVLFGVEMVALLIWAFGVLGQ